MNWAFRTMIVPSQYTPLASQLSALLAGTSGEDMFTTGLSATGTPPATHYVSTGYVSEGYAAVLPLDTYTTEIDPQTGQPVVIHTHKDGDPQLVVDLAAEKGVTVSLQEVTDAMNAMDCTEQEPFTAFARLGLQLVQEPINP